MPFEHVTISTLARKPLPYVLNLPGVRREHLNANDTSERCVFSAVDPAQDTSRS